MARSFHANGKLLLSAEYLVLKGALAMAIPLNRRQSLMVEESETTGLGWNAFIPSGSWFNAFFDDNYNIVKSSDFQLAKKLRNILLSTIQLNCDAHLQLQHKNIKTYLDFDPNWGWGSSSTLIHLMGQWLKVNPYSLLDKTFGGSGYDIACAGVSNPIFYRRMPGKEAEIRVAQFNPPFLNDIGLVWMNKKQISINEISNFLKKGNAGPGLINEISSITIDLALTERKTEFAKLLSTHENLISIATGLTPVKKKIFPDYIGSIKSLGAWGGDFAMFISEQPFEESRKYFQTKGYNLVFRIEDIQPGKHNNFTKKEEHII